MDYAGAEADLTRAVTFDPSLAVSFNNLGKVKNKTNWKQLKKTLRLL